MAKAALPFSRCSLTKTTSWCHVKLRRFEFFSRLRPARSLAYFSVPDTKSAYMYVFLTPPLLSY